MIKRKSPKPDLINKESDGEQWLMWSSGKHGQATGSPYHEAEKTKNHREKYIKND